MCAAIGQQWAKFSLIPKAHNTISINKLIIAKNETRAKSLVSIDIENKSLLTVLLKCHHDWGRERILRKNYLNFALHASLAVYTLSRLFTLTKGLNMDLIDFHRRPSLSFTLQVLLAKVRAVSIMKIFFQNLTSPYPYCTSFKVLIKMLWCLHKIMRQVVTHKEWLPPLNTCWPLNTGSAGIK